MNFHPVKRKQSIEDLPIKVYIEGKCFLCSKECESYVHDYCAVAYTDHKAKKTKEIEEKYNGWKCDETNGSKKLWTRKKGTSCWQKAEE